MGLSLPVNKFFPVINLVFVLTIALLATLSVRIWTHPAYPSRVDGASVMKSPKTLKNLIVSRPGYNAGTVSQITEANIFRKDRREYVLPPTPSIATPLPEPKTTVPLPNLVLKGILILGGIKIAFLEGNYWITQGNHPLEKKVKKRGYSLGQVVGGFKLTKIDKTSVTLDDNNGRVVRVKLTKRFPEKTIHREGTAFYQKNRKNDPRKVKPTKAKPKTKTTPVFRVSGAETPAPDAGTPAPRPAHISGR